MKYLAIAVLLAIVAGAVLHHFNRDGEPSTPERGSGWAQR